MKSSNEPRLGLTRIERNILKASLSSPDGLAMPEEPETDGDFEYHPAYVSIRSMVKVVIEEPIQTVNLAPPRSEYLDLEGAWCITDSRSILKPLSDMGLEGAWVDVSCYM